MQHLDEGTIHAWLDGALSPNEAAAAEAHVQACEQCAAAVAEARGLIAAASRVLGALDAVPAVAEARGTTLSAASRRRRQRLWWQRNGVGYAAAAVVLLAAGTTIVLRSVGPNAVMDSAATLPRLDSATRQPDVTVLERSVPPLEPQAQGAGAQESAARAASGRAASRKEAERPKEELWTDRVVPLPGAMPRPAAPPPNVSVDGRKAFAAAEPEAKGVVQGRVLDATTGAPVAGATVSIDTTQLATRTDSSGKFQLEQVPLGQQTISVRALGFERTQHQLAVAGRDSAQLAFALQRATTNLEQVVVTSESRSAAQRRAAPALLDRLRANTENILGCYDLQIVAADQPSERARNQASPASRIELESRMLARERRDEAIVNRARTLSGPVVAESWRLVGDSLELAFSEDGTRRTLRFVRSDNRWISRAATLQPCAQRE